MWKFYLLALGLLAGNSFGSITNLNHSKVVCFWNSTSFYRSGPARFEVNDLIPALSLCTHLVYGYAGIDANTLEAVSLNPMLDTGAGYAFYRLVTQLKKSHPDLRVYLSIGGNADNDEDTHKYLKITETAQARSKFIKSVINLVRDYDFDGVDLAWQFETTKVQKKKGFFGGVGEKLKIVFGKGKFVDKRERDHRDGFNFLVRDLNNELKSRNRALTLSVLPHVNSSVYYDVRFLSPYIDAVHLFAFDQKTPERNRKEADFPAPIYHSVNRVPEENIDSETRYWLEHGTPGSKIVIGIPTFARTWTMTEDSSAAGVPPVVVEGPGQEGPQTNIPGLLSYPEVCARLTASAVDRLTRVGDPSKKFGGYAYRRYVSKKQKGIWVGFEDPDTAGNKAQYVKSKGLGGVAIVDLSLDDFRGTCSGDKFPIVRGAKYKL